MSRHPRFQFLPLMLSLTALLACDEVTSPPPDETGTFSATVSGDAVRGFGGEAVFSPDVPGSEFGFAIALVDSIGSGAETVVRHAVYLYREVGGVPALGVHSVGAQKPFRVGLVLDGDGDDPNLCVAESGTVRITSATTAAVRGSFDVRAVCFRVGDELARDTILANGSFQAVTGTMAVPSDVTELPTIHGRFDLLTAGGEPLPSHVFDGIVLIGDDQFVHLEIIVTNGYLERDESGAYEQRVSQVVYVDGHPAPSVDWVDRGSCVAIGTGLSCASSMVANRIFTAVLVDGGLEVAQDLNGEGLAVVYRYVPGG